MTHLHGFAAAVTVVLDVEVQVAVRDATDTHGVVAVLIAIIAALQLIALDRDQSPISGLDRDVEVRMTR